MGWVDVPILHSIYAHASIALMLCIGLFHSCTYEHRTAVVPVYIGLIMTQNANHRRCCCCCLFYYSFLFALLASLALPLPFSNRFRSTIFRRPCVCLAASWKIIPFFPLRSPFCHIDDELYARVQITSLHNIKCDARARFTKWYFSSVFLSLAKERRRTLKSSREKWWKRGHENWKSFCVDSSSMCAFAFHLFVRLLDSLSILNFSFAAKNIFHYHVHDVQLAQWRNCMCANDNEKSTREMATSNATISAARTDIRHSVFVRVQIHNEARRANTKKKKPTEWNDFSVPLTPLTRQFQLLKAIYFAAKAKHSMENFL